MRRAAVVVLAFALIVPTGCGVGSGEDGGSNPEVPATAAPEEVVQGYLQALLEQDEDGATALTTYGFASRSNWPVDPPEIADIEIGRAQPDELVGPVQNEWDEAVLVPVTMTMRSDTELPDGPTELDFVLWRGRVNDRWLIADIA